MTAARTLRDLLRTPPVLAASCFDALSARLAELAGFKALHLTGMGVEATQLGAPDMGLVTMTELANHAARVADAVSIPVLADIDTGFGGTLNINRTVRELERAGVAGIHLEDQTQPKRCPVLAGRTIVSRAEGVSRIKAACDARRDADFVIVARTDADVVSFEELVERCNLYLEAGADMVMPIPIELAKGLDAAAKMDLYRRLVAAVQGPVMTSGTPPDEGYTVADVANAGFAFVMFASSPVLASANALFSLYSGILERGVVGPACTKQAPRFANVQQLFESLHLDRYIAVESEAMATRTAALPRN